MYNKVKKIKINITQKMNLGNYESRDYTVGLEIEGFAPASAEKVQEAIDFGRELCLKDVGDYYRKVKNGLQAGEKLAEEAGQVYLDLEKKIADASSEKDLRALTTEVTKIDDKKVYNVISKQFNLRLLALKK